MTTSRYIDRIDSHIPALDGVRGWSIIMVLIFHTFGFYPMVSPDQLTGTEGLFRYGTKYFGHGVDFFFVLSGFLITGILLKSISSEKYFLNFYARRTLRIFPLYYLSISAIFFVTPLFVGYFNGQVPRYYYLTYYAYLQNFIVNPEHGGLPQFLLGPMWSLAVEEHFYLIWPAIVWACSKLSPVDSSTPYNAKMLRYLLVLATCLVGMAIVSRVYIYMFSHLRSYWVTSWTVCRMDSILIGALLAILLRSTSRYYLEKWRYHWLGVFSALSIMAMYLDSAWEGKVELATRTIGYTGYALFFASIINVLLFLPASNFFLKCFDNRVLRLYGKHSYAIYIIHSVVNAVIWSQFFEQSKMGYFPTSIAFFMLSVVLSLCISWIIWHLFEKHFLALKRFFEKEKPDGPERIAVLDEVGTILEHSGDRL